MLKTRPDDEMKSYKMMCPTLSKVILFISKKVKGQIMQISHYWKRSTVIVPIKRGEPSDVRNLKVKKKQDKKRLVSKFDTYNDNVVQTVFTTTVVWL